MLPIGVSSLSAAYLRLKKGTRLTRAAMIEGDTPFIGATLLKTTA